MITALDRAHAAMQTAPEDDTARLAFFERLGDAELFLLLDGAPEGDAVSPQLFPSGEETLVLVFDREERLASFAGAAASYVALSGRTLCDMLTAEDLGLALNPEVAPSSFVLGAEGVAWLAATLSHAPAETEANFTAFESPKGLPEALLTALDQKLATAMGLAQAAYLVRTTDRDGGTGHFLGFVDALPGAEPALAQAVSEALTFSGLEAGTLDVGFLNSDAEVTGRLARVGLRFDLPQPDLQRLRPAPGSNPDQPPKLR